MWYRESPIFSFCGERKHVSLYFLFQKLSVFLTCESGQFVLSSSVFMENSSLQINISSSETSAAFSETSAASLVSQVLCILDFASFEQLSCSFSIASLIWTASETNEKINKRVLQFTSSICYTMGNYKWTNSNIWYQKQFDS